MAKVLMKGNEAMAEAALKAGCDAFFGYPITPQNELPEYLSKVMPERGKVFVQAESEVAAINMVYGAGGAGARVLTSSSSPGIALKQEGITYCAGSQIPCVIINVTRGGPGLGGIQPSQADYYQTTRGGGNGDYNVLAYAPETLQETCDYVKLAFDKADYYRNPVMIMVDGLIGQMMEPVDLDTKLEDIKLEDKDSWAANGNQANRPRNIINSLALEASELEKHNIRLQAKYKEMTDNEQRFEMINCDDAEIIVVAFGSVARIVRSSIELLRAEGKKVGLIRPISVWPFPQKAFENLPKSCKSILTVEMSAGQMVTDVKLAVNGKLPVHFYGRMGGIIPEPEEIADEVKKLLGGK